jgi:hypothetical protein
MIDTISYSPGARGWNSRHTWYPDWMVGMNSTLYTFKDGDLYKHDANANYNEFYGNSTAEITSGTDDAGTADKLTDSTATFNNGSILVDDYVVNNTTGQYAIVTAIDSATVLSLSESIFSSGDSYEISRNPTSVTFPFNDAPDEEKVFKTLALDSNVAWITDVTTDLTNGTIDDSWYKLKEGEYYAFIRRDANDLDPENLSLQGIGVVDTFVTLTDTLNFTFTITSSVNTGDNLYIMDTSTGALDLIGTVSSKDATSITVASVTTTPINGTSFIVVVKDSTAESRGARGSYMVTELKIYKPTSAELFGVATEAFKSNP